MGGGQRSAGNSELLDMLSQDPSTAYLGGSPTPTPSPIPQSGEGRYSVGDLVFRTESSGEPERHYSDDYTKHTMEQQRKKVEQVMNVLARLGVLDQLAPRGLTPIIPYRPPEERFGF